MTYEFLQHYWCFIVSLLGALLVFLLFVQGANSVARSLGQTEEGLCSILGQGLFQTGNYKEAFPYLQQMEDLATKKGRLLDDYWKGLVRICKELR